MARVGRVSGNEHPSRLWKENTARRAQAPDLRRAGEEPPCLPGQAQLNCVPKDPCRSEPRKEMSRKRGEMEIQSLGWFSDHGQGNCPKGNTGNWRPGKTRSPVVRIRRNPRKSGLQGRHPELSEPRSWLPCPEWWSLSPMAAPLGSQGSFSSDNTSHACFP